MTNNELSKLKLINALNCRFGILCETEVTYEEKLELYFAYQASRVEKGCEHPILLMTDSIVWEGKK